MDPAFEMLERACRELEFVLTPAQYDALTHYARLLRTHNEHVNLVSRRDTERIVSYHIVDSVATHYLLPPEARTADVGSGAGLPGIPLAIIRPDVRMCLVESSMKRSSFLARATAELNLGNVEVAARRAEDLPPLQCDVVLSRLTGRMPDVLSQCAHHLNATGRMVFYKTCAPDRDRAKALRVMERLGLRVVERRDVLLPITKITRRLVVVGPA